MTEPQNGSEVQNVAPFPSPRRRLDAFLEDHGVEPEDPAVVAAAMEALLRTPIEGYPDEIAEIHQVRSAARRLVEGHLATEQEAPLLQGLLRACGRALIPTWCYDAVVAELEEPEPSNAPPETYQARHEFLRRQQYVLCPTCWKPTHGEIDFDRWNQERRAEIRRQETRKNAVPHLKVVE